MEEYVNVKERQTVANQEKLDHSRDLHGVAPSQVPQNEPYHRELHVQRDAVEKERFNVWMIWTVAGTVSRNDYAGRPPTVCSSGRRRYKKEWLRIGCQANSGPGRQKKT